MYYRSRSLSSRHLLLRSSSTSQQPLDTNIHTPSHLHSHSHSHSHPPSHSFKPQRSRSEHKSHRDRDRNRDHKHHHHHPHRDRDRKPFKPSKNSILPYGYELARRYKIIKCIGKGRFSNVFSAYDKTQRFDVAVKVDSNPKEKELLHSEYEIMKQFNNSPYICKVYDFGKLPKDTNREGNYLCMELCDEKNLSDKRKECPTKCFGIQKGALIGIEMLLSLKAFHEKGFVHRDIKPSNFVIPAQQCWNNHLYIVDFGLSKKYNPKLDNIQKEAEFIGTSLYASITAHNKLDLSPVDDLWSVLFVIIDISTNSLPWKEDYIKLGKGNNEKQTKLRRSEVGKLKNEFVEYMLNSGNGEMMECKTNSNNTDLNINPFEGKFSYKMPEEYKDFMRKLKKCGYNDTPKYDELIRTLRNIAFNDQYKDEQYVADHAPEPLSIFVSDNISPKI